ncbi:MAG: hypothetical protein Q7T25_16885 [Sideroxyarcus sp.]|nr:hypothetical protein [Sideroxyarcus sp.]
MAVQQLYGGTARQQIFNKILVSSMHRCKQGSPTSLVRIINDSAGIDQCLRHGNSAGHCIRGNVEWCPSIIILGVEIGAGVDQDLHQTKSPAYQSKRQMANSLLLLDVYVGMGFNQVSDDANAGFPLFNCIHQGSFAIGVLEIDICSCLDKRPRIAFALGVNRVHQRRVIRIILKVDIGPGSQKRPDELTTMIRLARYKQCRVTV